MGTVAPCVGGHRYNRLEAIACPEFLILDFSVCLCTSPILVSREEGTFGHLRTSVQEQAWCSSYVEQEQLLQDLCNGSSMSGFGQAQSTALDDSILLE